MMNPLAHRAGRGLRYYWSLGFLLALCLALLLATAYLYAQTIQRQQDMISSVRESLLWASMQMERETQRWRLFLKESAVNSSYDPDQLELRFEILFSRYVTLSQGELREAIEQDDRLSSLLASIGQQIRQLDSEVEAYFAAAEGSYDAFVKGSENLLGLSNDFINLVISLRSDNATINRQELLATMLWLTVSVSVLIAVMILLIFLLVRSLIKEQKQVAIVSELAQQLNETAEQAKAASAAKSAFLAMMSHEIRTPLNGIMGMLNVLVDEPLAKKTRSYATAARDSADHLLVVVNDILDLSSIEVGRLSIVNKPMSLTTLLQDIGTLAHAEIKTKPIRFQLHIGAHIPDWMAGDRIRLRQVILNLVANAIKFTDAGEVHLHAQWKADQLKPDKGYLRLEVQDSGIGIDPKFQADLFQDFSQIDNGTNRRFSGTGLGLSICKKLVTLMGGRIGVSSQPGKGSLFWFEVPAKVLQPMANARAKAMGVYGFEEKDLMLMQEAATAESLYCLPLEVCEPLPENCETVFVNWQPPFSETVDAMSVWRSANQNRVRFIAVVEPDQAASAYEFIKAGGQSLLVRTLTMDKLLSRLRQTETKGAQD